MAAKSPEPGVGTKPAEDQDPLLPRALGLPGAIMLSFMIAGGVLAGGFLMAYGTLTERVSGHDLLFTAGGLGMFGRPIEIAARKAFRDQLIALLYALPALFIAFILTGWIAMTVVAVTLADTLPLVGVSIAYLVGFLVVAVAIRFGWFGARRAWKRFSSDVARLKHLRIGFEDDEE